METQKLLIALAVAVIILIAAYFAYHRGWLNAVLPAKWQHAETWMNCSPERGIPYYQSTTMPHNC